jgi:hypothetical protein
LFRYQVFEAILNIFFVLVIVLIAMKHKRISFDHVVIGKRSGIPNKSRQNIPEFRLESHYTPPGFPAKKQDPDQNILGSCLDHVSDLYWDPAS